jgi:hypothetical protein
VKEIYIEQDFEVVNDSVFLLTRDHMMSDFAINKKESSKEKILESHLKTPEVVSSNDSDKKGFEKYVKKRKNRFIEEYPELNNEQLFEKMKKKWRSLSDEKKQKYL